MALAWIARHDKTAFDDGFDSLVALFARFDANYVKHAREEHALLRSLSSRLSQTQRQTIADLLGQI